MEELGLWAEQYSGIEIVIIVGQVVLIMCGVIIGIFGVVLAVGWWKELDDDDEPEMDSLWHGAVIFLLIAILFLIATRS
jgi:hypothetical protein